MGRLEGKAALITGAGGAMGQVAAERFAAEGASVALVDVGERPELVDTITAGGGRAFTVAADVRDMAQVEASVAATLERFGKLDVLYNKAAVRFEFGGGEGSSAPFAKQSGLIDIGPQWTRHRLDISDIDLSALSGKTFTYILEEVQLPENRDTHEFMLDRVYVTRVVRKPLDSK